MLCYILKPGLNNSEWTILSLYVCVQKSIIFSVLWLDYNAFGFKIKMLYKNDIWKMIIELLTVMITVKPLNCSKCHWVLHAK